jgi:signal peptidase II
VPDLQAARGASLNTADPTAPRPATGLGRSATPLVLLVALTAYAVDQVSKHLAVRELTGRAPVEVVGSFLQLRLLRNPGAAFSAGASLTPVISVVALVAAVVVLVVAFRVRHRGWAVALGFLLAGVVGNLTDRMLRTPGPFRGHVVDFLALPHWPVFNVADICIDLAGAGFVLLLFRGVHLDGTRSHEHAGATTPTTPMETTTEEAS